MRIYSTSDLHVDFEPNSRWVRNLSLSDFTDDALIVAGDISDNLQQLEQTLFELQKRFSLVFFVPGNHDLWVRRKECPNSLAKFELVTNLCRQTGIEIKPQRIGSGSEAVWVVPLLSWYVQPREGKDSLFLHKPGEDPTNRMWSDQYFVTWPQKNINRWFLDRNEQEIRNLPAGQPVISFSHFLPRQELIFHKYPPVFDPELIKKYDRNPAFNFSRVAGSTLLDEQLRSIGSSLHIYGHQHRNRDRIIEGVRYISHGLGYPNEREQELTGSGPYALKLIFEPGSELHENQRKRA
jgi:predicted phosphodiesterase